MSFPRTDFEIFRYTSPTSENYPGSVAVQIPSSWSHVGSPLDPDSLPSSYNTWSRATFLSGGILDLLSPFLAFIHKFMAERHMTHYCLTIRAQKETTEFDIPRWHVDRRFSVAEEGWKFAAALLGPGTIFLRDGKQGRQLQKNIEKKLELEQKKKGHYVVGKEHICTSFRCLGCADMAQSVRLELAEEIKKRKLETVSVGTGEVVVFRVDGYNEGDGEPAMHSEPPMSRGDRVFVHVIPGREGEMRRLVQGWGMEFPRSWYVGVPEDLET